MAAKVRTAMQHSGQRALSRRVAWPAALQSRPTGCSAGHAGAGLCVVATPMAGLREQLQRLPAGLRCCGCARVSNPAAVCLGHEIAREVAPACLGVLSGPSFALEVAGASRPRWSRPAPAAKSRGAVDALHSDSLRIYSSSDVIGSRSAVP